MINSIFGFVVVIGALVFAHELGHFLLARWLGVRVLVFSLGFGPRIWGWTGKDGVEYLLCAVPLGGYVKMFGEGKEEGDTPLTPEENARSFSHKSVGVRSIIVAAGPIFNFLFAFVAMTAVFLMGVEEQLPVLGKVEEGRPAAEAGLQPGDRIVDINGNPVERWEELTKLVRGSDGKTLTISVERDQKLLQITVKPLLRETKNIFGEAVQIAMIGVGPDFKAVKWVRYGPIEAIALGLEQTWRMIDLTLQSVWKLITRVVPSDQIGGPLMIGELAGKAAAQGVTNLLYFMALVSVNLGLINLFPVPVLDGGHLLFFAIEAIKGGPLSEAAQNMAARVGIALLSGLMVLAFYNDIVRILSSNQ